MQGDAVKKTYNKPQEQARGVKFPKKKGEQRNQSSKGAAKTTGESGGAIKEKGL